MAILFSYKQTRDERGQRGKNYVRVCAAYAYAQRTKLRGASSFRWTSIPHSIIGGVPSLRPYSSVSSLGVIFSRMRSSLGFCLRKSVILF